MEHELLDDIVRVAVKEAFNHLYEAHRPIALSFARGVSSTAFAEAYGVYEVAMESVNTAYDEARKAVNEVFSDTDLRVIGQDITRMPEYDRAKKNAEKSAREGVIRVIQAARAKNLLFLRDGSRSATIVLAHGIAMEMKGKSKQS